MKRPKKKVPAAPESNPYLSDSIPDELEKARLLALLLKYRGEEPATE